MRIFVVMAVVLAVSGVVDTVWFDGHYGRTIWQYINHEVGQAENQVTSFVGPVAIRPPNLSRHWKIP